MPNIDRSCLALARNSSGGTLVVCIWHILVSKGYFLPPYNLLGILNLKYKYSKIYQEYSLIILSNDFYTPYSIPNKL